MDVEEDYPDYNHTLEAIYEIPIEVKIFYNIVIVSTLLCVAVDLIIAYVIIKFRRLRDRKPNIIILNWTICNILYMVLASIAITLDWYLPFHLTWFFPSCMISELYLTFLLGNVLFNILLTMYWILEKHNPEYVMKLDRTLNFFIIFIYIILLFCASIHAMGCLHFFVDQLSGLFAVLGFLAYFLFMVIILITDFIKTKLNRSVEYKRNINQWLTIVFFLSYVSTLIGSLVVGIFRLHHLIPMFIYVIALFNPIYNIILLYKMDPDYRLFINHVFTGRSRTYNTELKEEGMTYSNADEENVVNEETKQ